MRVGDGTINDIDHKVDHTAMAGVFDLGDILGLINDGLQDVRLRIMLMVIKA